MKDFENIYLTGDTHADFEDLILQSIRFDFTSRDLLIILGDVGINYFGDARDTSHKDLLARIPATILCIRGNHEMRPTDPALKGTYRKILWMGDEAFMEDAYPRFIMAADGARYHINDHKFLVIGGAYSVDKPWRLAYGYRWFPDEQLTAKEMKAIRNKIVAHGDREDIILAHTCPCDTRPVDCFIQEVDESLVDNTMERFLQEIVDQTEYNAFYCGNWHINRKVGRIQFLFHDIVMLEEKV